MTPKVSAAPDADRPTVVVLASIGFAIRNYLTGACLDRLLEDVHVVVFSPLAADESFRRMMADRGVEVRPLLAPQRGSLWRRVRRWREAMHVAWIDTDTWRLKRSPAHHESSWRARAYNEATLGLAGLLASRPTLRWADALEARHALACERADGFREELRRLKPALVFSAAPLIPDETLPLQVARAEGIPTALSVLSWDNLSSKSRLPLPVSRALVWGPAMRDELLEYYPDVPAETVRATGAPQFDFYRDPRYAESRTRFCGRVGLDPERPVIVWGGVTEGLAPDEPRIVADLAERMRSGAVRDRAQLLLRLHPKDDGSRYDGFRSAFPEVVVQVPGGAAAGNLRAWNPGDDEVRDLVAVMTHGNVHINIASTLTVDAAVADRPVVNVGYDLRPAGAVPSWGICGYGFTHYKPVVASGGAPVVRDPGALVAELNAYLGDPTRHAEGRRRIVERVCGTVDGRAGERVATELLDLAGRVRHEQPIEATL